MDSSPTPPAMREMRAMRPDPVHILLVEDDPVDAWLTHEALRRGAAPKRITVVGDGEEALALLRQEPPFEGTRRPDLILLDLTLPRLGGQSVLETLKSDPRWRSIPVLVLTGSATDDDVAASYDRYANGVLRKPATVEQLVGLTTRLEEFWFSTATLPSA